mmetsp:Transcript_10324/g.8619  ORF Transcript_10324/g.8619 Transcript_10324/m.8619 type:complete len:104 (-) Transcript_10324:22-333(-)
MRLAIKPTLDHPLPPALPLTIWQGSEQMLSNEDRLGPIVFKAVVFGSLGVLASGRTDLFYYIGGIGVLVLTFYVMNSTVFVFPHIGLVLLGLECYSALTTSKL